MKNGEVPFPYESFRKGQRELSEEVARGVLAGDIVAVKAPTGFGKTAAVIHGLLSAGVEKVLYVVRTVNEIDPVVRELKRFGETFTVLFSARRVCPLLSKTGRGALLSHEDFWRNCAIARIKGLCDYYAKAAALDSASVLDYLRKHPDFHALRLALGLVREKSACPFFSLIKIVDSSRIIVATYPYLFEKEIFAEVFYDYEYSDLVIVVDEAHNLLNAQSLAERRIDLAELREAAREIERHDPRLSSLSGILLKAHDSLSPLARYRWRGLRHIDKSVMAEALESYELLADVEREIREAMLTKALLETGDFSSVSLTLTKVVRWLESLKSPDYHLFATQDEGGLQLVSTPLDPAVVAREPLDSSRASVLMSGTLPPLDVLKATLGLSKPMRYVDVELLYGSTIPRSNIYTIVVADVTTLYRERGAYMYHKIAKYLTLVAKTVPGVKLAVYPSYELMKSVTELLPLDIDFITETSSSSLSDVEDVVRNTPDILINAVAGGKLVEGVEFTDEDGRNILHVVVVVGVPFPHLDDFTEMAVEALSGRFKSKSEARRSFYLNTAVTRVKQALGRAVRSPEDRAVFILLDYRYLRRDLRELLRIRFDSVVRDPEGFENALRESLNLLEDTREDSKL